MSPTASPRGLPATLSQHAELPKLLLANSDNNYPRTLAAAYADVGTVDPAALFRRTGSGSLSAGSSKGRSEAGSAFLR